MICPKTKMKITDFPLKKKSFELIKNLFNSQTLMTYLISPVTVLVQKKTQMIL